TSSRSRDFHLFIFKLQRPPSSTLFPYPTLFRSPISSQVVATDVDGDSLSYSLSGQPANGSVSLNLATGQFTYTPDASFNGSDSLDRKSTRLNSSHVKISYAVFCLKKKNVKRYVH